MTLLCISDNVQNNLVIVDVEKMAKVATVPTGLKPYPVDAVSKNTVFVSTRGEQSVLPVDAQSGMAGNPIALPHKPRSTTDHPTKSIALVGGVEKSITSVVDTSSEVVLFSVGEGNADSRRDYGGGLACGHPAWVSDQEFMHLDRVERRLELFSLSAAERLDSCNLPTSPHHMEAGGVFFYVMCEGNQKALIPPSVAKIEIVGAAINVVEHQFLPVPTLAKELSGGHHLTVDLANNRVYAGTADARLFTLDATTLSVLNIIDAGKGCGHVTLCPEIGLAVTTNHTDTFMTVFELASGRKYSEIEVSTPATGKNKTQGHTSKWFPETGVLVTTAAQDGKVLEIDVQQQKVKRKVDIPGAYLIQGTFL